MRKLYSQSRIIFCVLTLVVCFIISIHEDITFKLVMCTGFPIVAFLLGFPGELISRKMLAKGDRLKSVGQKALYYILLAAISLGIFLAILYIGTAFMQRRRSTGSLATELSMAVLFIGLMIVVFIAAILPTVQTYIVMALRAFSKTEIKDDEDDEEESVTGQSITTSDDIETNVERTGGAGMGENNKPGKPEGMGDIISCKLTINNCEANDHVYEAVIAKDKCSLEYYDRSEYWDSEQSKSVEMKDSIFNKTGDAKLAKALEELFVRSQVYTWNGFVGTSPEGVLDGSSFSFEATLSDGSTISASGSNNFPKGYGELKEGLYNLCK